MNVAAASSNARDTRAAVTPECELCQAARPRTTTNTCGDSCRTPSRSATACARSRERCTTISCTGAGTPSSASMSRAMRLTPQLWLCLKRMTGASCEAVQTASRSAVEVTGRNWLTSAFYRACLLAAVALTSDAGVARAQTPVVRGATEWSASAGAARGITFLQSVGGERYLTSQLSWGRVLTDPRGPSWARGRFEWAVEVVPVFAEWSAGKARGLGVTPLGWRWNLEPRGRVAPFAEVGGGALWTSAPIPSGTTGSNFTAHAGLGVRVFTARGQGLVVGYRLHHISNGNRLRRNPGVNAHMLTVGWTRMGGR